MIRSRDAKKRQGYNVKMTHALDFTSIPLKIGGIRSTLSPWQCLLECCVPCFFSFPLSWWYFTLLIKFHRAIWSPLPRAVSHLVPSFSPHHSSLLIPFAALRVHPMSILLSSGPSLFFSTTAIFLQSLKELKISQKPHVCTLGSCWTIWLKVFGDGSLKLAFNTTFSLRSPQGCYQSSIMLTRLISFPLFGSYLKSSCKIHLHIAFYNCPFQLTPSPATKIQGLPSEPQDKRAPCPPAVAPDLCCPRRMRPLI